ncbi:MAG: 23S rRNA (uracil(1939)-C(5))-methyltransferase RlmD [Clostridia bacterium]|nr:23S rRNA (uracil(1939)-C(5))-methyltransferase RlmD [Clostridia bacterium]
MYNLCKYLERGLIVISTPTLNKEYTLNIEAQGSEGEGIAKLDGYALFVNGAITGDTVLAKITKLNKSYGFAKLIKILTPSANRVEPICPKFHECGGCRIMNMSYKAQCEFKRQLVYDALKRIGSIEAEVDFVGAKEPLRYRNKMVFPFSEKGEWGFYKGGTHEVVPLKDCPLGDVLNIAVLDTIRDFCKNNHISSYNEKNHSGVLRRVFTRVSAETGEMMVVISVNSDKLPNSEKLVAALLELSPRIASVILNINKKRTNLVLGDKNNTLWGKDTISDNLLGFSYEISPHSFFQINHAQTERLYNKALEYAQIDETKTVFDLYCGIGTISLSAARLAKKVIGVEIVPQAIENAKKNAKTNGIANAEFYCAAAEDITPKLIEQGIKPDTVILDPPRKGSDEKTLGAIVSAKPKRIVYVSCNPATLARDVKFLTENGYKTEKVTAFDLFPQTSHIETVCKMTKR